MLMSNFLSPTVSVRNCHPERNKTLHSIHPRATVHPSRVLFFSGGKVNCFQLCNCNRRSAEIMCQPRPARTSDYLVQARARHQSVERLSRTTRARAFRCMYAYQNQLLHRGQGSTQCNHVRGMWPTFSNADTCLCPRLAVAAAEVC